MGQKRRRVIKKDGENQDPSAVPDETGLGEPEPVDTELLAAVSYKLNESTILIRNILAKPDGGHSEMELGAFVNALAAFEIAAKNPERFVEVRAQYSAKEEESVEEEVEE